MARSVHSSPFLPKSHYQDQETQSELSCLRGFAAIAFIVGIGLIIAAAYEPLTGPNLDQLSELGEFYVYTGAPLATIGAILLCKIVCCIDEEYGNESQIVDRIQDIAEKRMVWPPVPPPTNAVQSGLPVPEGVFSVSGQFPGGNPDTIVLNCTGVESTTNSSSLTTDGTSLLYYPDNLLIARAPPEGDRIAEAHWWHMIWETQTSTILLPEISHPQHILLPTYFPSEDGRKNASCTYGQYIVSSRPTDRALQPGTANTIFHQLKVTLSKIHSSDRPRTIEVIIPSRIDAALLTALDDVRGTRRWVIPQVSQDGASGLSASSLAAAFYLRRSLTLPPQGTTRVISFKHLLTHMRAIDPGFCGTAKEMDFAVRTIAPMMHWQIPPGPLYT